MAKLKSLLLDTGPTIAFLDGQDPEHECARRELCALSGQIHTTAAVVTEVMHCVAPRRGGAILFAEFLRATKAVVHGCWQPSQIRAAATLMDQDWDSRMDYADTTLLVLADHISVFDVLTLDRRGFAFFRTPSGRSLQILESTA